MCTHYGFELKKGLVATVIASVALSTASVSSDAAVLEEIVVTAQKRAENLQSVPISISAFTSSTLERYGIDNSPLELQFITPGLQTTQVVSGFSPRIRAIGSTDSTPGNESSVSMYVDGVYIPASAGGLVSLSNIDRVEVLKGPQGTLFGRNATGGLINVITRTPSSETGGNLSISYDNFDTPIISGYVTTGVGENAAVDFSGRWENQGDGWGKNLYDGSDTYKNDNYALRSKLYYTPTDEAEITLAADYYDYDNEIAPFRLEVPSGYYDYDQDLASKMTGDAWGLSAHIGYEFDFATLVSISAYRDIDQGTTFDVDQGPTPFQHAIFESYGKSFSQELQLLSPDSSEIDWILGLFYFQREAAFDPGAQKGTVLQLAFNPPLDLFEIYNKQDTTSYSAFAQMTYPLLEDFNLTLGIRYTDDEQKYSGYSKAYPLSGMPVEVSPTVKNDLSADKWTYRLALDYSFTPDIMGYVSYNTGFKSGFFNISGFPADSAGPETLEAYEVGLKSQLFGYRMRFNIGAYIYDYKDVQTQYILQGQAVAVNAGSATVKGLEMESVFVVTDGWNLRVGFNWMPEAEYDQFSPCPGPQNPPWVFPPGSGNYECGGSDMVNAPEWDVSVGTDYSLLTSVGEFDFSLAYQYLDDFAWDADFGTVTDAFGAGLVYNPKGVFVEPSRSLVNAHIKWVSTGQDFSVSVWGRNLTDEEYLVNGNQSSGSGQVGMPGEPRTYGVTLGLEF